MRKLVTSVILCSAQAVAAQLPPIVLEWSALRPYNGIYGNTYITRDPVTDEYLWAVFQEGGGQMDEMLFPFLADGTDLAPTFPYAMNVGSLDYLIEFELKDGALYNVMRHQLLGGAQPFNWHVRSSFGTNDWDVWLNNPINSAEFSEIGLDLLVTNDVVYSCGGSGTGLNSTIPRVLKLDHQGNELWNVTWDPVFPVTQWRFSSVAVIGDTVACAMFPDVLLFNGNTGDFIGFSTTAPSGFLGVSDGRLHAYGNRIYWTTASLGYLHAGWFEPATGQFNNWYTSLGAGISRPEIVIDQYDHIWLGCSTSNTGHWFRLGLDLTPIDSGTYYAGIDDMSFVNNRISFTGPVDATGTTAIVTTGTPQP